MRLCRVVLAALVPVAGCQELTGVLNSPDAPTNLSYQLIPSGSPNAPLGVLLTWEIPPSGRANAFNVYGRASRAEGWQLRGTTTSPSFHDEGAPDLQYYVATRDDKGNEIGHTVVLTIDLEAGLPAPQALTSMSLNGAVQLLWTGNTAQLMASGFDHYRVYSTAYDTSRGVCTAKWLLEGTTVSDAFLASNLPNGVSRCFAVSALTHDGHESVWSDARIDTPRWDAHTVVVYSTAAKGDSAGFLFLDGATGKMGVVSAAARQDVDFAVVRQGDGSLWLSPGRAGVTVMTFGTGPIDDLTSVDRAPATGYGSSGLLAVPAHAYVFRVEEPDGVHYAALRVGFATAQYVVFDWAYQSAVGSPDLRISKF